MDYLDRKWFDAFGRGVSIQPGHVEAREPLVHFAMHVESRVGDAQLGERICNV